MNDSLRASLLAQVPPPIREEAWTRTSSAGGRTETTTAMVSVLPGEVVLVTTEVIETLLGLCGFARVEGDCDTTEEQA